jgi:hypothetical protein
MSTPLSNISITQRLGLPEDQHATYVKQMLCKTRVAMICIVQAFDAATQTVSVLPAVMEQVYQNVDGVPTPTNMPWTKPFGKIPVIFPLAGPFVLTMPIQEGDECLVIFNDMCFDAWWQSGDSNNVQLDKRRHDLSDGIAIFGIWSQPNKISDYSTTAAELRTLDGAVKISLSASGIEFTGPVTFNDDITVVASKTATFNGPVALNDTVTVDDIAGTLQSHTHTGGTISGDTGPPIP